MWQKVVITRVADRHEDPVGRAYAETHRFEVPAGDLRSDLAAALLESDGPPAIRKQRDEELRERLEDDETLTKVANTLRPYGAAVESVCEDAGFVLLELADILLGADRA